MASQGDSKDEPKQEVITVAHGLNTVNSAVQNFVAGNIAHHFSEWRSITSDPSILEIVSGYLIDFERLPYQTYVPYIKFSKGDEHIIAVEVQKLLDKGVLSKTTHCNGEFISSVFTRPKKDGSHRLILNLKNLNEFVTYQHFKMESLQSAAQLLKKDYWMAVLDLKDAYYSVPINLQHRKYLRFEFNGTLYEFTCLPNGLASAPRVFTKLMKPVYATLRSKGYLIVGYIDDILLMAETPEQLSQVVADTVALLRALGFTIHDTKSVTTPSQIAKFLGFILNSKNMTISMIPEKADIVRSKCHSLVQIQGPAQIREVASVVGLMVSSFAGVYYGPLFYRSLENIKTDALQANGWDLEGKVTLSPLCKQDLLWWINNVDQYPQTITPQIPHLYLTSDSSLTAYFLELKAILLGLQSLCSHRTNCTIKVIGDNTTAVSYIRSMGRSKSRKSNDITREILLWCMQRQLALSISHIPGKLNTEADRAGRESYNSYTEWSLDPTIFDELELKWATLK